MRKRLHFLIAATLTTLVSCLDSFVYEKQIVNKYYLLGADSKRHIGVYLRLRGGDYIGRVPDSVVEYAAYRDSLLITRNRSSNGRKYYLKRYVSLFVKAPGNINDSIEYNVLVHRK
jgi:hypothetical protein